jgi:hypothetical protein
VIKLNLSGSANLSARFDVRSYFHRCASICSYENKAMPVLAHHHPLSDLSYPGVLTSPPALTLVRTFIGLSPFSLNQKGKTIVL